MNEIDHLLTGDTCNEEQNSCGKKQKISVSSLDPRYVRWEECAMMRSNFKNSVTKQFEKVDTKIDTNNCALETKIDSLRTELIDKIDANNTATGGKLDTMNTNLINVSNSMVIAAFSILGAVVVAIIGLYLIMK